MSRDRKTPLLQGSLDLMVLQALKSKAMHGYAITRHIQEASENFLKIEEGSLYPALHRMEQRGWIKAHWGLSESNRCAKFYELSSEGHKQLRAETVAWKKMSQAIDQVLGFQS